MEDKKPSRLKFAIIFIVVMIIVLLIARYMTSEEFRNFVDLKFFGKQVSENNLDSIELKSEDNPSYFALESNIILLSKNKVSIYNNKGEVENDFSIDVSNPIIDTCGKFAVVAEKGGNKFYVINSTSLLFQGKIDEKINKIFINQNGYISIIASSSTYDSIIIVYDNDNNQLFKQFLKSTYAMKTCISNSNKELAIGEVDYSGTVIKSKIEVLDVATAKSSYSFNGPDGEILTNLVYNNSDKIICSFSGSVYQVEKDKNSQIYSISDQCSFANIDMKNTLATIERESSGLFSYEYKLKLKSTTSSTQNIYILKDGLPKTTTAKGNYIALNYGNQVYIVNKSGILKKQYTSTQQIKELILGNHICGIVYNDKIEIISL